MLLYEMKKRRQRRSLRLRKVMLLFSAVVVLCLPHPTYGFFFFRIFNACRTIDRFERCGLLNLSVVMHVGDANTKECEERCVFFTSNMNCGSCIIIENVDTPQPDEFNVYIDLVNVIGIGNGTYFNQARKRWQQIITGDLVNIGSRYLQNLPSTIGCNPPETIDDLYICAQYSTIDGRGKILGSAGPTHLRLFDSLPMIGEMKFDYADIYSLQQKGTFDRVILHEMGHILGIGTIWTIADVTGPRSTNCPYLGTAATAEFRKISNCTTVIVPTENDFDRNGGTFCSHWDEECMGSELMTGFLENNNQSSYPLSRISIAGLDDLGYTVDYTTADSFTKDDLNANCQCTNVIPRRKRQRLRSTKAVHQFGILEKSSSSSLQTNSPTKRRQRRRISDEAYEIAMSYGLSVLSERTEQKSKFTSVITNIHDNRTFVNQTTKVRYIGDQIISILIEDGGEIYGVMVINDEAMM